jgi:hypothetical protein
MYSIRDRRGDAPSVSTALILGNTALWLALLAGTGMFAYVELRWTTIVVVSGILFLFVPELFQALPTRWRDGDLGLFWLQLRHCLGFGDSRIRWGDVNQVATLLNNHGSKHGPR